MLVERVASDSQLDGVCHFEGSNAKARAVIPILRKFTVARLLEPHCKLWTWADLGGLGRTGAVRRDSDLLGPICMSSEILEDFVDEV